MSIAVRTRRFSVIDYHRMIQAGILKEDDRVELVEGDVIEMTPIGPRHTVCVNRLNRLFNVSLGDRAVVQVQSPVVLGPLSEPQPDVALLHPPLTRYTESHPGPGDLFLVIEVAETKADEDRRRKIPLYARAGVREAWLVNLPAQTIEQYRAPTPEGYTDVQALGRGHGLAPQAFPDLRLAVEDILG